MGSKAYNQAIVLNSIYTSEIQALLNAEKNNQQQELSREVYDQDVDKYNQIQMKIDSLKNSVQLIINLDNDSVPENEDEAEICRQFQHSVRNDYKQFQVKTGYHSERAKSLLAAIGEEVQKRELRSNSNKESNASNLVAGSEKQKQDPTLDTVRKAPIPVRTSTAIKEQKSVLSENEDDPNEIDKTNYMDKASDWYSSNIKIKAAPNELKDGSAPETEETRKLRKTELEQKIREIRKLDQQKKSDAQLEYQVLLGMQSKERKLRGDVEAMNLEKIKKKEEFDMSKLYKVLEDAQDELKNSSIYEESVKQQKNSVSKSMKSLTLNLTEGEAERRNLEELENKKKKKKEILNPEATLMKSVEEQKKEAHLQCLQTQTH